MNKEVLQKAGINYERGLTYFGQDEQMYRKYLLDFCKESYTENAMKDLENGEIKDAFHNVHSLKSLVEYVSIPLIDEMVHEITETLREGKTEGVMDGLLYIKNVTKDIKETILMNQE